MTDLITEASVTIADDGDVLITIPKPNGMNIVDEVLVYIKDNFLMLGQNKKCFVRVEMLDIIFLNAIRDTSSITLAQCDDDGFDIFDSVRMLSKK